MLRGGGGQYTEPLFVYTTIHALRLRFKLSVESVACLLFEPIFAK